MPCTEHDDQEYNQRNQRSSFRTALGRTFVGLRLTDSQHQDMPSFAIVSPSDHRHNLRQAYQNQRNHRHHEQNRASHNNLQQMAQSSTQPIPRAILSVADDLTEQIRLSVQDTHISPRSYLNEINTGGNISEVLENYDNLDSFYTASAAYVTSEGPDNGEQIEYLTQSPVQSQGNLVDEQDLVHVQENSNISLEHSQYQISDDVQMSNNSLTSVNHMTPSTGSQNMQQSLTTSHQQQNINFPQALESSQVVTASSSSYSLAQSRRLLVLDIPANNIESNTKPQVNLPHAIISTSSSKIPRSKHSDGHCGKSTNGIGLLCTESRCITNPTDQISRNLNELEKLAPESLADLKPSNNKDHSDKLNFEEESKLTFRSIIPIQSSHRQAGVIKTNLHDGSSFSGFQRSKEERYEVSITMQHVDFGSSYLCGYLSIYNLTKSHPLLTTFFEGEIISERYPFLTRKWEANEAIDRAHWSKFEGFDPSTKLDSFDYKKLQNSEYVFMRWKEHFLVPDHTIKHIDGASYAGFYYTCYSKRTSQIKGYYFHINSDHFESFQSLHLKHDHQNTSQVYEFR